MPTIGKMRWRVELLQPSLTVDAVGQSIESFGSSSTRWAYVEEMPAGETNAYEGTEAKRQIKIVMRSPVIKADYERYRVVYDSKTWNVKSVRYIDMQIYLEMIAEVLL